MFAATFRSSSPDAQVIDVAPDLSRPGEYFWIAWL
jgi:hypothetical protein